MAAAATAGVSSVPPLFHAAIAAAVPSPQLVSQIFNL
jgi:hypothetical protein